MLNQNKIHFPNLDGLRFFAFLMVFINHATTNVGYYANKSQVKLFIYKYLSNGDIGVNFFFVLSGFLISYLLLNEKETFGKINIPNFYMRRVLRIWPLYYFILIIGLLVIPYLFQFIEGGFPIKVGVNKLNPYLYMAFLGNFDFIYHGITNSTVGVLWSVSVEEQFYLLWPLVIAVAPKKYLKALFLLLIVGSISYRFFLTDGKGVLLKFHTLSSLSDLATGALLALMVTQQWFVEKFQEIKKWKIVLIYIVGITLFLSRFYINTFKGYELYSKSFLPVVFSLFFAFVIFEQNFAKNSFYKIGKWKMISNLGKYTYGMYCYHIIVFFFVLFIKNQLDISIVNIDKYNFIATVFVSFLATVLVSYLSYHYFEAYFLKLKNKFQK